MLLDYQMELNFASGLLSLECWKIRKMMPRVINSVDVRVSHVLMTIFEEQSVFRKRSVIFERTVPCHKLGI